MPLNKPSLRWSALVNHEFWHNLLQNGLGDRVIAAIFFRDIHDMIVCWTLVSIHWGVRLSTTTPWETTWNLRLLSLFWTFCFKFSLFVQLLPAQARTQTRINDLQLCVQVGWTLVRVLDFRPTAKCANNR
jgi:hypothetical protein